MASSTLTLPRPTRVQLRLALAGASALCRNLAIFDHILRSFRVRYFRSFGRSGEACAVIFGREGWDDGVRALFLKIIYSLTPNRYPMPYECIIRPRSSQAADMIMATDDANE